MSLRIRSGRNASMRSSASRIDTAALTIAPLSSSARRTISCVSVSSSTKRMRRPSSTAFDGAAACSPSETNDLAQPIRVPDHDEVGGVGVPVDLDVLRLRAGAHGVERLAEDRRETDGIQPKLDAPADHRGSVEEVVDEPGLRAGASRDDLER